MTIKHCPKLCLAEMQETALVLSGLLTTDDQREQLRIIEAEFYQLQVMIENDNDIKGCKVSND